MPRKHTPNGRPPVRPASGPKPETVELGRRCLVLLAEGVERSLLAERLQVSRKQVNRALRVARRVEAGVAPDRPRVRQTRVIERRTPPPPGGWAWQDQAACKGKPLHWFFDPEGRELEPAKKARTDRAKAICAACPVRTECLDYAIARPEKYGTWGGLPEDERASERRKRMKAASNQRLREARVA